MQPEEEVRKISMLSIEGYPEIQSARRASNATKR